MGLKEKWKASRERRRDPYDKEEERLRNMIAQIDPLDARYSEMQEKLKNNIRMQNDSKENHRKIAKADRGGVLMKILSVAGAIGGGFMIGKFERDGLTYTGEKRSFMDAIARTFGQVFFRKD